MAYDCILKPERLYRDKWFDPVRWKMPGRVVTITLTEKVYEQTRQAAERSHRPVDDVLAEAVTAAAPVMDMPPGTQPIDELISDRRELPQ
jgi:hypothetical protein